MATNVVVVVLLLLATLLQRVVFVVGVLLHRAEVMAVKVPVMPMMIMLGVPNCNQVKVQAILHRVVSGVAQLLVPKPSFWFAVP